MICFKKAPESIVMSHDAQAVAQFSRSVEYLQANLQLIVNEFNTLEIGTLAPADLIELIAYPERIYSRYKAKVVDELHIKEQSKASRKLNRAFIEGSIDLPSPGRLMQFIHRLGDSGAICAESPELFELIKGVIHLNSSLLASIRQTRFRILLTDPAKIALYHLMHKYAEISNDLSAAFAAVYPNKPSLVKVINGSPFDLRAYHLLKADFTTGKVIPRLDELK